MRAWVLGFMLLCLNTQADDLSSAEKSAEALMQQHQQQIDSPEAVNANLMEPLTTDKKMQTFDGKQQFSAKIQPQAGKELLKLTLQPLPTGDVKILSIAQDLKLSGKLDSYSQPNWIISGVCANGFIRCDPGSWNNCQSFAWTTDGNKQLAIKKVPLSSLGGCYCINNSCGTGLAWSNLSDVLSHLGGGAVGAIVQKNPLYSLGAPKITDTTVTYYGQNNGDSSTANLTELPNMAEPQRVLGYAAHPQKMEDDKASQAKNDTIWKLIKESQASETPMNFVNCRIDRIIKVDSVRLEEIIEPFGDDETISFYGDKFLRLYIDKLIDGSINFKLKLNVLNPSRILSAKLNRVRFGARTHWYVNSESLDIRIFANGSQIFSIDKSTLSRYIHNMENPKEYVHRFGDYYIYLDRFSGVDFTDSIKTGGLFSFDVNFTRSFFVYPGHIRDHAYVESLIEIDTSDRILPDQVINGCAVYENDKDYLLVDETIDGVNTFKNYAKTGLRPVAQTRTISGPNNSFKVTRDFFLKERRYLHKNNASQKYEFDFERTNYIQKYSTERQYHDQYEHNGQVINSQGDLFSTDTKPYAACTLSCKAKKPRPQHDVSGGAGSFNVTGEKHRDPVTYDFFYRPCKNGVCPLEPGEILVKDCQCLEEFNEAAAMMQVLRMAGNDLICSSGATKTLGVPPVAPQKSTMPNWVCSKGQEEDGVARLTHCQADQQGSQFCPIDAVPCQEESYEIEEDKTVDTVRVIPGYWKGRSKFLGVFGPGRRWIPEQRVTEKQVVKVNPPKKRYACPLGSQYPCMTPTGSTIAMCTPKSMH